MLAPMSMAKHARRRFSMPLERARRAFDTCRAPGGRSSSLSIIQASSTGRLMKQISSVSRRTRGGSRTRAGGCGHCGRRLHTHYRGRNSSPGYHCAGKVLIENRGVYCLNIGGIQIDEAITRTFVAALEPAGLAATLAAAERLEAEREVALKQWRVRG